MNCVQKTNILLPNKNIDLKRWAVIACDQFTSQKEYWYQLESYIKDAPSTLHLIYPEAFLNENYHQRIEKIHQTMKNYLHEHIFDELESCMILIKRTMKNGKSILGIVLSVDLEMYSYEKNKPALIRATEETVLERIPPRVEIRKNASLEFPHVVLLMNDQKEHILEKLYQKKNQFPLLYQFELNMDGGFIEGYKINDCDEIIDSFRKLIPKDDPLQFVVGDGNHSLASAKAHWENIKKVISKEETLHHPARYALVEVENIYDDGLRFEAIHRVLFHVQNDFMKGLKNICKGNHHSYAYNAILGKEEIKLLDDSIESIRLLQNYIDDYLELHKDVKMDYVHDEEALIEICNRPENKDAIGIIFPAIKKEELFTMIQKHGSLPRKSFSMGKAIEKRYYLEGRKIM